MDKLKITLDGDEILCLQLALIQASNTTFTDTFTRGEMQKLAERIDYAIKAQCPGMLLDQFVRRGDF
jgi:hypothetical protein